MRWAGSSAGDVAAALEEFARRIGVFDPPLTGAPQPGPEGGVAYSPAHAVGYGSGYESAYEPEGAAGSGWVDDGGAAGGGPGGGSGSVSGGSAGGSHGGSGIVEVRVDGGVAVRFSPGVARAFVEALGAYQDPRDRGACDHCGGPRLDDNFVCADCGQPSGLFGQLLRERAARYEGPAGELDGGRSA
jgi:hypothetical protein